MPEPGPVERLVADGLLWTDGGRPRTTSRWQASVARAALRLQAERAPWKDLRLPIALAVVERYPFLPDEEVARLIEAILPVEEAELAGVRWPAAAGG